METQPPKPPQHKTEKKSYDSNPFTLSFDALGRFFTHNVNWAIALIVLGVLGMFSRAGGNLISGYHGTPTTPGYGQELGGSTSPEVVTIVAIVIVVFVIALTLIVAMTVIATFLQGMFSYVALRSEAGESVSFSEAFNETTSRFWRLLGAQLLAILKIIGWGLLFIVPGIVAALKYSILPYSIMSAPKDEKGVSLAHAKVKAITKGRLMEVFGVAAIGFIIPLVGSILTLTGNAAIYNQLNYYYENKLEKPKVHWLNYAGFFLLVLLLIPALILLGLLAFLSRH